MRGNGKISGMIVALAALLGASPLRAQDAPKTYWVCSILVPTSLVPPVADYIISDVFQDQTPKADEEAAQTRHAAGIMIAAKAAGHALVSGVPTQEVDPYCEARDSERKAQDYRLQMFAPQTSQMAVRRAKITWAPQGAVAIAADPVPPLPPAKPGRVGVTLESVSKNMASRLGVPFSIGFSDVVDGAILTEVSEGGAAQRSGLQMLDVVIEIAGQKITSPDDFRSIVSARRPGTLVTMSIIRFGVPKTMDVLVGE